MSRSPTASTVDRAVVPMIGKALEASIVVLFIGVVTTALYAGIVPDYRSTASAEVGDRALVAAADGVERSVPPDTHSVASETRVDLPATVRNANYRIVAEDDHLRLDHPHRSVGGTVRLAVPEYVVRVEGTWRSGGSSVVRAESTDEGLVLSLENR